MAYNLNYDEILKGERDKVATQKSERDTTINTLYDSQKTVTTDEYNRDIEQTKQSYADAYQKNAVQKLINERQIAENMENLGLTDSGLNRTQQTAAQLSYANQKGKLDISKQQTLDQKSGALAAAIATIEQNRAKDLADNADYWSGVADKNAQEIYKTNYDAYTAEQKAIIEANTKLQEAAIKAAAENTPVLYKWQGQTVVDDNKNTLLKFTGSDGKTYNVTPGKNPYTNSSNATVTVEDGKCVADKDWREKNKQHSDMTVRACARFGVFGNGYQPKGVCYINENGTAIDAGKVYNTGSQTYVNGKLQNIWSTADGQEWVWNGYKNCYQPYEEE